MQGTVETPVLAPDSRIHWVGAAKALNALCDELGGVKVLGLAVRSTADLGNLCLVQIAPPEHMHPSDPFAIANLSPVAPVLAREKPQTIVHDARFARRALAIRDRGPGVPPELLKTIFEPFFRAEQELTRKHKGSGIGLALVAGLAAAMRGRVTAHLVNPGSEWPGLEVRLHLVAAEPS